MIRASKDSGALRHSSSFPEQAASWVVRKRRLIPASRLWSLAYHRELCADENQNARTCWKEASCIGLTPCQRAVEPPAARRGVDRVGSRLLAAGGSDELGECGADLVGRVFLKEMPPLDRHLTLVDPAAAKFPRASGHDGAGIAEDEQLGDPAVR